jgi:hypothetical protein
MGTDIHIHVEIKIDDTWHHLKEGRFDRDYILFGKMAGVRNPTNLEPIAPPRGLPEDVTICTLLHSEQWEEDAHSHSWLSSEEVSRLEDWWDEEIWSSDQDIDESGLSIQLGYLFYNNFTSFFSKERAKYFPERLQDFRWVFWFDN